MVENAENPIPGPEDPADKETNGPTDQELLAMIENGPVRITRSVKQELNNNFLSDPWIKRQLAILYKHTNIMSNTSTSKPSDPLMAEFVSSFWTSFLRDWTYRRHFLKGFRK